MTDEYQITKANGTTVTIAEEDANGDIAALFDSVSTEEQVTTESSEPSFEEWNPHSTRSAEHGGIIAFQDPPAVDNPVYTASDTGLTDAQFVADPFWRPVDGTLYMFFEVKYTDGSQDIAYATSPDGLNWSEATVVAVDDGTAYSYPWFQKVGGTWYSLINQNGGGVRLYTIENFPEGWTEQETILDSGTIYLDPTPIYWEGRWYLITHAGGPVELWVADEGESLTGRTWTEHPDSPIYPDDDEVESPAGRAVVRPTHIEMPMVDSSAAPDLSVRSFRITDLSPTSFSWSEVNNSPNIVPDETRQAQTWIERGSHHIDRLGGDWAGDEMAIIDGRLQNSDYTIGVLVPARSKSYRAAGIKSSDQSITSGSDTTINWASRRYNIGSHFDPSTGEYAVPVSGYYNHELQVQWLDANSGDTLQAWLEYSTDGGSTWSELRDSRRRLTVPSDGDFPMNLSGTWYSFEGTLLRPMVRLDGGTGVSIADSTRWGVAKDSGQ